MLWTYGLYKYVTLLVRDHFTRQILTFKVGPLAERASYFLLLQYTGRPMYGEHIYMYIGIYLSHSKCASLQEIFSLSSCSPRSIVFFYTEEVRHFPERYLQLMVDV